LKVKEKGEFAEYREIYGNLYGTPKSFLTEIVSQGKIPILHFGLTGVKSFLENYPDANTVFITLTNVEEVRKRLEDRGSENGEMLEKRIKSFEKCQFETT
jgi:guanylate kinase